MSAVLGHFLRRVLHCFISGLLFFNGGSSFRLLLLLPLVELALVLELLGERKLAEILD